MPNLLFEIGAEEIPPSYILPALDGLRDRLKELLAENDLESGEPCGTGTPRRVVLFVENVPERQTDAVREIAGPSERGGGSGVCKVALFLTSTAISSLPRVVRYAGSVRSFPDRRCTA